MTSIYSICEVSAGFVRAALKVIETNLRYLIGQVSVP